MKNDLFEYLAVRLELLKAKLSSEANAERIGQAKELKDLLALFDIS